MPVVHDPDSPQPVIRSPSPETHPRPRDLGASGGNGDSGPSKRAKLTSIDYQRIQLEKLLSNPEKEVQMPKPFAPKPLRAPVDLVKHVSGSSSGAGSGEFHVYKQSRRREYERLKRLADEAAAAEEHAAFVQRQAERDAMADAKTAKNRARRQKRKAGRDGGSSNSVGGGGKSGNVGGGGEITTGTAAVGSGKSKFEGSGATITFRRPGEDDASEKEEVDDDEEARPVPVSLPVAAAANGGGNGVAAVDGVKIMVHDDD